MSFVMVTFYLNKISKGIGIKASTKSIVIIAIILLNVMISVARFKKCLMKTLNCKENNAWCSQVLLSQMAHVCVCVCVCVLLHRQKWL
jgi:hypothetical protein